MYIIYFLIQAEEKDNLLKQAQEFEKNREMIKAELSEVNNEMQDCDAGLKDVAEKIKNCASQKEPIQVKL